MTTTNTVNALLVRLSIGQFSNTREDDSISREVRTLHKLGGNAGKWIKVKLDDSALADTRRVATGARAKHYELTLPWIEGFRLLPLAARPKYEEAMQQSASIFNAAIDAFLTAYPAHVEKAKTIHNGTFTPADYPGLGKFPDVKPKSMPAEEWSALVAEMKPEGFEPALRECFSFRWEFSPVPKADHFVGLVAGQKLAEMQAQLEAQNAKRIEEAIRALWDRVLEPVRKMADTLSSKDTVFRDSLVGNVRDICELVPSLNLTGDHQMKAAVQAIRDALGGLDPDVLRSSRVVRRTAAEAASTIVKRFGSLGARKFTPAPDSSN